MSNVNWITPALEPLAEKDRPDHRQAWWMRRVEMLDSIPAKMTLSVVCLGYYELYVNGKRVSDEPLAPSLTRLDRRGFAIVHDITGFLVQGENCLALWCSSGWYLPGQFKIHEGWTPLLQVQACRGDASGIWVGSGDEWLCRSSNRAVIGPWVWNQFGGEEVDARAELPDWNQIGCDTKGWHKARVVSAPPITITERNCPPNRIGEVYPARAIRSLDGERFEVDFGTCLAGWVDIRFRMLAPGQTVTLRFYDLPADNDRKYQDGRRVDHSYGQRSVYHARGDGTDRFENKFNYAGFRYMTIEGLDIPPALEEMKALLVESDLMRTSSFCCSNELFNRIHELNIHTLRCLNLGGYSVDCPHRERFGYGADGQTSLPAYLYAMDSAAFLRKWLVDWCDIYEPETGRISLCAPNIHAQHAPAWGGIVVPLAWSLYLYYGDRDSMEKAFPVIQGHLRFLQNGVRDGLIRKEALGSSFLADWVPVDRGMDSKQAPDMPMRELFNSCYLIILWELYIRICRVLGKGAIGEAEANIAALRAGIHREFYRAEDGLYLMPEQSYQAMPLLAGVVPAELRPAIRKKLLSLIEAKGWHMDTGLPGTTLLLDLLGECDEHEVIQRIYEQETYPGWGYMLACGATAIWEQWNGYWSQIHSCFAGPAAWFYSGLAGIRPDEARPGFESFILAPAFVSGIDFVEASYDSIRGHIRSSWKREDGRIAWAVTIPANTTATVLLPVSDPVAVSLDGRPLEVPVQCGRSMKGDPQIRFQLAGGSYLLGWAMGKQGNRDDSI
jgi:alpha-L-rhamnosidase